MDRKIAVAGTGYVGLAIATLLSRENDVTAVDVIQDKVDMINKRISPIKDEYIEDFFETIDLHLTATTDGESAYKDAEFVVVATPTNYDSEKNYFDTTHVEEVIDLVMKVNPEANIIIKSTIPVGFCDSMYKKYEGRKLKLYFSPEFLREGHALYDNLYPSRIIVGIPSQTKLLYDDELTDPAVAFVELLKEGMYKEDVKTLIIKNKEAEAVKLFANTYLAMRVAYFNELDTYAEMNNMDALDIIEGVCADPRIGNNYNNPSFGYGGYCLPKDTKQLLANYSETPQNIIEAIVESNETRKNFISASIINKIQNLNKKRKPTIGIYRLAMKADSDNFRQSSILDIIDKVQEYSDVNTIIYEPTISEKKFNGNKIVNDFEKFSKDSDIIVANRYDQQLYDAPMEITDKVFTRDLFWRD